MYLNWISTYYYNTQSPGSASEGLDNKQAWTKQERLKSKTGCHGAHTNREEPRKARVCLYIFLITQLREPGGTSLAVWWLRFCLLESAGGVGSTSGQGTKIPHALQPKSQNIKQKQYCNKFNKNFENSPHQKKKNNFRKKERVWTIGITYPMPFFF